MQRLLQYFSSIDPGWVRLEQSIKGALAFISATLVTTVIIILLKPQSPGSAAFYSLLVAFISFVSVNDSEIHARQRTLLLAFVPFIIGPFAVATVGQNGLLHILILLTLMFFSYIVRRYGIRAAELGVMSVFAYYFSLIFGAEWASAPWFVIGAVAGVLSAYAWQFLIRPYSPKGYLYRSLRGMEQIVLSVVKAVDQQLAADGKGAGKDNEDDPVAAAFARVQRARQVIEQYLSAVTSLSTYPQARLNQLRLQLFNIEQGLQRLIAGSETLVAQREQLPIPLQNSLHELLSELQVWLKPDREEAVLPEDALAAENAEFEIIRQRMHRQVQVEGVDARETESNSMDGKLQSALWQFTFGALQITQSVGRIHVIISEAERVPVEAAPQSPKPAVSAHAPASTPANATASQQLHPTTKLAIQATLASGLAMLASYLLNLDHPNWAFWTAYIVVTGSTGESLRKIFYRVFGTLAGAALGTLLVVILPHNDWLVLGIAFFCMFLALYTRIVSYAWMVFWIVIFVALLYGLEGEARSVILFTRPVNTLIGALLAAAVVWFVFPLHARDRFRMGVAQYLKAVEQYVGALVASWLGQSPASPVEGAKVQMEEIYDKVAQVFPSVALEYNPITQARSPLSCQTTIVQAIHNNVDHLTQNITTEDGMIAPANPAIVQELQTVFQNNIKVLEERLAHPLARINPSPPAAQHAASLEDMAKVPVEAHSGDWQQAIRYFDQLNQALAMLNEEVSSLQ